MGQSHNDKLSINSRELLKFNFNLLKYFSKNKFVKKRKVDANLIVLFYYCIRT